ncbi:complement C1q-like protein 4 [Antennarius striatus]|uniref:complement C1q-like protein 4 n=1 Tax=Antennarius striatus TaxID=241820 RepID=UPI0035AE8430
MASKVMFTAVADQGGKYGPFPTDRTLVFNTTITDIGGGYDKTSGEFTAPSSGYYYFTFFYHAGKEQMSGLTLMKNSNIIVNAYDQNQPGPNFCDNAGNAAFLQLNAGDRVYVRLPANCRIYASDRTTSFSGFMVAPM